MKVKPQQFDPIMLLLQCDLSLNLIVAFFLLINVPADQLVISRAATQRPSQQTNSPVFKIFVSEGPTYRLHSAKSPSLTEAQLAEQLGVRKGEKTRGSVVLCYSPGLSAGTVFTALHFLQNSLPETPIQQLLQP